MSNHDRDIGSQDYMVMELVKELKEDKFLVPTSTRIRLATSQHLKTLG